MSSNPRASSKLTVANDVSAIPVVLAYVRAVAASYGFGGSAQNEIELAVEEAVSNVVEHAYLPGEEGTCDVQCSPTATGLEIAIRDQGLPFDPSRTPEYRPGVELEAQDGKGLGSFLMRHLMDACEFRNLGTGGKETRLLKHLASPSVSEGQPASGLVDLPKPAPVAERERLQLEVRWLRPEEAIEAARCVYRAYGYSYVYEHIYYPERIVAMNESGDLRSAVAVTPTGEIAGHAALVFSEENPGIGDLAVVVTVPKFRGQSVARRIGEFLVAQAEAMGLAGVFVEQVTAHLYTQKFCQRLGYADCAVGLAYAPGTISFKGISETLAQRESVIIGYKPLRGRAPLAVYPPKRHAEMIGALYDNIGVAVDIREETPREREVEHSVVSVRVSDAMSSATVRVWECGSDIRQRLHHEMYRLIRGNVRVVQLYLNLADPATPAVAREAEAAGFFFTGILPETAGGDSLIMEALNGVAVDYDAINVESAVGRELLAYVRTQDPYGSA